MIVFFDEKTAFLLSVLTNLFKKKTVTYLKKIWVEFVGNIATVGLWERRGGGGSNGFEWVVIYMTTRNKGPLIWLKCTS